MDFENAVDLARRGSQPLVQSKDAPQARAGAAAATSRKRRRRLGPHPQRGRPPKTLVRGSTPWNWAASERAKGHKLDGGIKFRRVPDARRRRSAREGRAYLHFWPGGRTSVRSIQLRRQQRQADSAVSLLVSPAHAGRVTVKPARSICRSRSMTRKPPGARVGGFQIMRRGFSPRSDGGDRHPSACVADRHPFGGEARRRTAARRTWHRDGSSAAAR